MHEHECNKLIEGTKKLTSGNEKKSQWKCQCWKHLKYHFLFNLVILSLYLLINNYKIDSLFIIYGNNIAVVVYFWAMILLYMNKFKFIGKIFAVLTVFEYFS